MSLQTDILDHAGPTITEAESRAVGLDWYEDKFLTFAEAQWVSFGAAYGPDNTNALYERAQTYYVWWTRTGDSKWRTRASAIVDDYILNYLAPSGNNPSPHFSQAESLYLKYLIEGDTDARDRLNDVINNHLVVWFPKIDDLSYYALDNRIQARVMMALWMAEKIQGSPLTITYLAVNYNLDNLIPRVLANQNVDGFWPFISACGFIQNFTAGMLAEFLARIYDQRPAAYNADILTALELLATYMWETQWHSDSKSFNYLGGECLGQGGASPAPDLNGFALPLFGWLGSRTGDQSWFDKGDQILEGLKGALFERYKQFSEAFTSSYRYLGYRYAVTETPDPIFYSLADGKVPGQYYDF